VSTATATNPSLSQTAAERPSLRRDLRELWAYRELLWILVQRDLKVRYKNSLLGVGWTLINPLLQVLTIALVLQFVMKTRTQNYHAYLFCATLPWLFFSQAVMDTSLSLAHYHKLMRRVYFPREVIPLAAVIANLIHFGIATGVFLLYAGANSLFWWAVQGRLDWPILPTVFLIPIPMLGLTMLVSGLAMFLSVWALYFEDVRFLADSGMRILYWLVPIIYFPDLILGRSDLGRHAGLVYTLYMMNPLASYITAYRKLILPPTVALGTPVAPMGFSEWLFLLAALVTSFAILLAGLRFFSSRKWRLAERA